jgi:membrane-associated protease RseP (regulator of RpoE activity)
MSRFAPLDRALVLILVPIWVVCFSLAMKVQLEGGGAALIGVSTSGDRHPVLTGESSALFGFDPLEKAGLRGGDVLIRVGETDLRGFNALQFHHAAWSASVPGSNMTVSYERGGEQRETILELVPVAGLLPWQATSLVYVASALFLLLRARPTPTVRAYFHAS